MEDNFCLGATQLQTTHMLRSGVAVGWCRRGLAASVESNRARLNQGIGRLLVLLVKPVVTSGIDGRLVKPTCLLVRDVVGVETLVAHIDLDIHIETTQIPLQTLAWSGWFDA